MESELAPLPIWIAALTPDPRDRYAEVPFDGDR